MPHLSGVRWDFADRMQSADLGGGGTVHFVYDAGGERVRKVRVNEGGGRSFERIYVGGFEVYRERVGGTVRLERESVHVGDDAGRMCLLETRTVRDGEAVAEPQMVQRYQYGNHLGSAALELTEDREVISYEEYHPYGTSSYRAANSAVDVSERRYRYTGKERDEETGLGYHGARYYACWLGRWTASDPIGLGDGVNRYAYVSGNPVSLGDPSGTQAMSPPVSAEDYTRLSDVSLDSFGIRDEPEPKPKSKSKEEEPDRSGDGPIAAESRASKEGKARIRAGGEARSGREYDASRTVGDAVKNSGGLAEIIVEEALGAVPVLGWAVDAKGLHDAIQGFNESPGVLRGAVVVFAGAGFVLPFTGRFGKGLRHLDDVIEEGSDLARRADGVPSRSPDSGSTSPSGLGDEVDAVPGGSSSADAGADLFGTFRGRRVKATTSRINVRRGDAGVKGSGLDNALKKHGGSGAASKSQFSISEGEIIDILGRKDVITSPIRKSGDSGNFIREVHVAGDSIGNLPLNKGGTSTSVITIITDVKGNLVNVFPGTLGRRATL